MKHKDLIKWGILLIILLILVSLWRWGPLGEWISPESIVEFAKTLRDNPYAPLIVVGAFLAGSLVAFPVTILIGATALVFNPWLSLVYSYAGVCAAAAGSYAMGSLLGRDSIRNLAGSRINSISRNLANRGTLAVAIVRNVPLAPFTIMNIAIYASHIRFRDYMLGTMLGILPGITAVTIFSNQLKYFLRHPSSGMLLALIVLATALSLGIYLIRRWLKKKQPAVNNSAPAGDDRSKPVNHNKSAIRVASYNIHGWVGSDGKLDPARIIGIIRQLDARVVALQEVELPIPGTEFPDGVYLEKETGMKLVAGPTIYKEKGTYGNVLLTSLPVISNRRHDLSYRLREPRGAIDVNLRLKGRSLRVVATHLGLLGRERHWQVRKLVEAVDFDEADHLVLMGDFNEWLFFSRAMRHIRRSLHSKPSPRTFPSGFPLLPLDRIWVKPDNILEGVDVYRNPVAVKASDHLPVVAELRI